MRATADRLSSHYLRATARVAVRVVLVALSVAASAAVCAVVAARTSFSSTNGGRLRSPPACCTVLQLKADNASLGAEARKYMRRIKPHRLHDPLETILREGVAAPSQPHPLLGRPAVDFTLDNEKGRSISLGSLRNAGPVLLVFYPGYFRDQCVAPLFALEEDVAYFDELGATIVAVSSDPPLWTADQFNRYGKFSFRVLCDPGRKISMLYGAAASDEGSAIDSALHAMFVIDSDGVVRWVYRGADPFAHTDVLLRVIAACNKSTNGDDPTAKPGD